VDVVNRLLRSPVFDLDDCELTTTEAVHDVSPASRYWGWRGVNLNGWIAMLAGVAVCLLTVNAPILDGPVSKALDGADFTWTLGPLVSALVYWLLVGVEPLKAGPAP
jgi:cytosine/uracil/thiamine/allantoin permease